MLPPLTNDDVQQARGFHGGPEETTRPLEGRIYVCGHDLRLPEYKEPLASRKGSTYGRTVAWVSLARGIAPTRPGTLRLPRTPRPGASRLRRLAAAGLLIFPCAGSAPQHKRRAIRNERDALSLQFRCSYPLAQTGPSFTADP